MHLVILAQSDFLSLTWKGKEELPKDKKKGKKKKEKKPPQSWAKILER